jgi:ferredoxin
MAIHIQEDELLVGANTEHPDYFPLYPELSYSATIVQPPMFVTAFSSIVPNYETILEDGLEKRVATVRAQIDQANAKMRQSPWVAKDKLEYMDKIDKWKAMVIADEAVMAWAQRYARLAKIIAENFEEDDTHKEELLEISDICRQVPAKPPRGLRDAMQCKWFTYLICHSIERYASGYGQKEDKLMWPYYKMSVIDQTGQPMTRDEAQEIFECERLKVSEHGSTKGRQLREFFAGANDLFILTLGGLNADGSDGCNDCTDVILDAAASMKTTEPSIGFRWNAIEDVWNAFRTQTRNAVDLALRAKDISRTLEDGGLIDRMGVETLFECRTCGACVEACPAMTNPLKAIWSLRQHLMMERGEMPANMLQAYRNMEALMHPFSSSASPSDWRDGLEVPVYQAGVTEYLLWVGCAVTYEDRAQKIGRAVVELLNAAGISYGIIEEARCTGDPAKQMGDDYLFAMMAEANMQLFDSHKVQKIITICPHCCNSFSKYSPPLGGRYKTISGRGTPQMQAIMEEMGGSFERDLHPFRVHLISPYLIIVDKEAFYENQSFVS